MIKIHKLTQGTPEWHAHRSFHWNASETAIKMGLSPYKTRRQLMHELHSGVQPEVSDFVQERVLDKGHRIEELARPIAESIIGEDLYPVTVTCGKLSASCDGLNIDRDRNFECKQMNEDLRKVMVPGCKGTDLPMHYQVQMEHQCMVTGAKRVLFMACEQTKDGIEERHCWYTPNPELATKIMACLEQFNEDMKSFVPDPPAPPPPMVEVIEALPALMIRVEGRVMNSNMDLFRAAADRFIAKVKKDLVTDEDFVNAEEVVKFCQDGEDRLAQVKEHALAQTSSIDELFRTVDHISERLRQTRLFQSKLLKEKKASIRAEIIQEHQRLLDAFVEQVNKQLGQAWIQRTVGAFDEALKGTRTLKSARANAAQELANCKLKINEKASLLFDNRKYLKKDALDWFFLFADFATLGTKPAEDFKAIAEQRIGQHKQAEDEKAKKAAEQARLATEKAVQEALTAQQAKADAQAKAAADAKIAEALAAAKPAETTRGSGGSLNPFISIAAATDLAAQRTGLPVQATKATEADEEATLKLGDINAYIGDGFTSSEAFLITVLKIQPAKRNGRFPLFRPSQMNEILSAMASHCLRLRK